MRSIDFVYDLYDRVVTPFGDKGIVDMLGVNEGGIQYYVKTAKNDNWFREEEIEPDIDML